MAQVSNSNLYDVNAGILNTQNACVVIVRTEWNAAIIDELEAGCRRILAAHQVDQVVTITVPGAFEIPFAVRAYWEGTKYHDHRACVFIALGCVIQGDTPHFDYVCRAVTDGVVQLNLTLPVPTIFGVLTVNTEEQAQDRLGGRHGHKGEEAGMTALKMVHLHRLLKTSKI